MKIKWITILASMLSLLIGCAPQQIIYNENCYEILDVLPCFYQDYNFFVIKSLTNNDTLFVLTEKKTKSQVNMVEMEEGLQINLQLKPLKLKILKIDNSNIRTSRASSVSASSIYNTEITNQDTVVAKLYIADEIEDKFIDPKNVGCK